MDHKCFYRTVERNGQWVSECETCKQTKPAASAPTKVDASSSCQQHPNGCPTPTADNIEAIRKELAIFDEGGPDAERAMLMLEALAPMMARRLVASTPAPSTPGDSREQFEETAWLIEKGGLCLGTCEYRLAWVTFTNEDAIRFSRKRDALSTLEVLKWSLQKGAGKQFMDAIVTEHSWELKAAQPPEPAKCPECGGDRPTPAPTGASPGIDGWMCDNEFHKMPAPASPPARYATSEDLNRIDKEVDAAVRPPATASEEGDI